jgi:hypothetical protein
MAARQLQAAACPLSSRRAAPHAGAVRLRAPQPAASHRRGAAGFAHAALAPRAAALEGNSSPPPGATGLESLGKARAPRIRAPPAGRNSRARLRSQPKNALCATVA